MMIQKMLFGFVGLLVGAHTLFAEEIPSIPTVNAQQTQGIKDESREEVSETSHSIILNGVEIKYTARSGTLFIRDEKGNKKASFFYVSYTREGAASTSQRPISFCFNGGPGSSSVWLHMGALGPKRVVLQDGFSPPPYKIVNNEYCFLDVTDLVFIDPVSTGYSQAFPVDDAKQFHGVEEDIKSVGQFIRLYTTRYNRWDSPKFIIGESYGTTRASGLAGYLHDTYSLYLNGIILVSAALNYQTLDDDPGNDLPYVAILPSYTAAAWYHKKLDAELQRDLEKSLTQAEEFALHEYAPALLLGDLLPPEKKGEIAKKISHYTGLSESYINNANLRVCESRFTKELLRDQKRTLGRYDSRAKGIDEDACGETPENDQSLDNVFGAFTAVFNHYVRTDLKWEKDDEYKILANVFPWNWKYGRTNKYLNVTANLRDVMTKNPSLRVYIANGYFDLATPYFATDYSIHHLGLDPSLRDHITMGYYQGGHMVYLQEKNLKQFKNEAGNFITSTLESLPNHKSLRK